MRSPDFQNLIFFTFMGTKTVVEEKTLELLASRLKMLLWCVEYLEAHLLFSFCRSSFLLLTLDSRLTDSTLNPSETTLPPSFSFRPPASTLSPRQSSLWPTWPLVTLASTMLFMPLTLPIMTELFLATTSALLSMSLRKLRTCWLLRRDEAWDGRRCNIIK